MILQTFESFIEDREKERELTRQQEQGIIANFPEDTMVDTESDETMNSSDTLAKGKSIASEFPVELVEEPQSEYFSTEHEINTQFPLFNKDTK
jgi:hypothetical protein